MHLTNPRALAGGIEEIKPNGVLTPDHSFWVKTHLCLSRSFPPAKARGLVKCISCFLNITTRTKAMRPKYLFAKKIPNFSRWKNPGFHK